MLIGGTRSGAHAGRHRASTRSARAACASPARLPRRGDHGGALADRCRRRAGDARSGADGHRRAGRGQLSVRDLGRQQQDLRCARPATRSRVEPPKTLRLVAPTCCSTAPLKIERSSTGRVTASAPDLGKLSLLTTFETCKVVIGGRDFGYPPLSEQPLAPGTYEVVLKCPGRRGQERACDDRGGPDAQGNHSMTRTLLKMTGCLLVAGAVWRRAVAVGAAQRRGAGAAAVRKRPGVLSRRPLRRGAEGLSDGRRRLRDLDGRRRRDARDCRVSTRRFCTTRSPRAPPPRQLVKRYATGDCRADGLRGHRGPRRRWRSIRRRPAWIRRSPASIACRGCFRASEAVAPSLTTRPRSIAAPAGASEALDRLRDVAQ